MIYSICYSRIILHSGPQWNITIIRRFLLRRLLVGIIQGPCYNTVIHMQHVLDDTHKPSWGLRLSSLSVAWATAGGDIQCWQ